MDPGSIVNQIGLLHLMGWSWLGCCDGCAARASFIILVNLFFAAAQKLINWFVHNRLVVFLTCYCTDLHLFVLAPIVCVHILNVVG